MTLVDCRMGPATTKFTPQADIELRPWLALEGLLLGDEELVVSEAQVRLRHQRIWASWSPFSYEFEESSLQPKRLAYHAPAGRVTAIPGGTLSIEDDSVFWPRPQQGDAEIKSQCKFVVSLDSPLPLRDFLPQYILPLETLISLATTSIARIESLHVTDKSWIASATESGRSNLLKVWFGRSPSQDDFRDITSQDLLFLLSDYRWEEVGGNLFSILPNWRYIIDQWITLINRNYRWPIPRFLTAVTIVEAVDRMLYLDNVSDRAKEYDQIASNVDAALASVAGLNSKRRARIRKLIANSYEPSLEDRLKRLSVRVACGLVPLNLPDNWAKRVAALRNQISHGLPAVHDLARDHRGAQVGEAILLHLLESLFLAELGFTTEELEKAMMRRAQLGWRASTISRNIDSLPES
ncbi:hypothetical protein FLW16_39405 [Microbispora sp. KK1-11]|nr:hypothetical protein FLW16_39405 [Microbispora sp. KK1-11]